jgi:hypothetical protein
MRLWQIFFQLLFSVARTQVAFSFALSGSEPPLVARFNRARPVGRRHEESADCCQRLHPGMILFN